MALERDPQQSKEVFELIEMLKQQDKQIVNDKLQMKYPKFTLPC